MNRIFAVLGVLSTYTVLLLLYLQAAVPQPPIARERWISGSEDLFSFLVTSSTHRSAIGLGALALGAALLPIIYRGIEDSVGWRRFEISKNPTGRVLITRRCLEQILETELAQRLILTDCRFRITRSKKGMKVRVSGRPGSAESLTSLAKKAEEAARHVLESYVGLPLERMSVNFCQERSRSLR